MDLWNGRYANICSLPTSFLSSEDLHRISFCFYSFLEMFMVACGYSLISGMDLWDGKARPAAPKGTFAGFQAGFSSSEDFHRTSQIYRDF